MQLYWDDAGGYFLTATDARDLIVRTKSASDSAVPSGNGSMVFALARLFYLTGKQTYRMRADRHRGGAGSRSCEKLSPRRRRCSMLTSSWRTGSRW